MSLAIGDVDRFKQINDTLGHDGGDDVLRDVAACLIGVKRGSDGIARLGGEEFALLMPGAGADAAEVGVQRLRSSLTERRIDASTPLTISFGVATFPGHGGSVEELMRAADRALYAAKALGRDRVVIYGSEPESLVEPQPVGQTELVDGLSRD